MGQFLTRLVSIIARKCGHDEHFVSRTARLWCSQ